MWKLIRVSLLLSLLIGVAATTWLDHETTTAWKAPLWVGIFPMNGDGSDTAASYVRGLTVRDFADIETFFANEASRFGVPAARPVRIELYPSPDDAPPALEPGAGPLATVWWSLRMRWFAHRAAAVPGRAPAQIRVFVLYHDPAVSERVPHSHGLQKGLIGLVHAFADEQMRGANNIVIAHETLHTVGATDKYDAGTGAPVYPGGYAEPDRTPRFPQLKAEIMAGERPLSARQHEMPDDLRDVAVGRTTAMEIGWTPQ